MVTLAIMAILSAVIYPIYENQVRKARRSEAKSALLAIGLAQERYYTVNGQYGSEDELGVEFTEATDRLTDRNGDGTGDYYAITIAPDDPNQLYTITATAIGPQLKDTDCRTLVVNQFGLRTSGDDGGADSSGCW
jgi:type IV pilus assembly protein PilE